MDPIHVHLLVNHVPVVGTVLTVGVLAYALMRGSDEVTKVSLWLFVSAQTSRRLEASHPVEDGTASVADPRRTAEDD